MNTLNLDVPLVSHTVFGLLYTVGKYVILDAAKAYVAPLKMVKLKKQRVCKVLVVFIFPFYSVVEFCNYFKWLESI